LLIAMMIIVNITGKSGVFDYIAVKLLKLSKGHLSQILFSLSLFTAISSAYPIQILRINQLALAHQIITACPELIIPLVLHQKG